MHLPSLAAKRVINFTLSCLYTLLSNGIYRMLENLFSHGRSGYALNHKNTITLKVVV